MIPERRVWIYAIGCAADKLDNACTDYVVGFPDEDLEEIGRIHAGVKRVLRQIESWEKK